MSEFKFHPGKTYELLLKQANAMQMLIRALEKQKAFQNVSLSEMAREIALQGFEEINAQRDINEKLTNEIMALEAERDALKAELENQSIALRASVPDKHKGCASPVGAAQNYICELEAELEEARKQSPVAWLYEERADFDGKEWHANTGVTTSKQVAEFRGGVVPLYAKPVPAQPSPAVAVPDIDRRLIEDCLIAYKSGLYFDGAEGLRNKVDEQIRLLSAAPTPPSAELTLIGHWNMDFRFHSIQLIDGIMKGSFSEGTPIYAGSLQKVPPCDTK